MNSDAAIRKLSDTIGELERTLEAAKREIYYPTLLVHPSSSRKAHDALLVAQAAALGALLGPVSELIERLNAVRKGVFLLERSCQAARTSINALPEEILRYILMLSRPVEFEWSNGQYEKKMRARHLMDYRNNASRVCRRWSSAIASQNFLWDSILLPSNHISLVAPFFEKTSNTPVSLIITPPISRPLNAPTTQTLLNRLNALTVECNEPSIPKVMQLFGQARTATGLVFPALESLSITYAWGGHFEDAAQSFPSFVTFPSLRSLNLDGIIPRKVINAPLLKHLSLGGQDRLKLESALSGFLEACTNLNTL
ncbi:hypothetical protein DL93DRAFT_2076278, partial [Clavulina sp. PMI_390]